MICPECNKENKENAVFCEFCGANMNSEEAQNTPEEKAEKVAETQLEAETSKGIEVSETENAVGSVAVNANAESEDAVAETEGEEGGASEDTADGEFISDAEGEENDASEDTADGEFISETESEPVKDKKGVAAVIAIVAVCVIAAIIVAIASFSGAGKPVSPVDNMISGLNKSNPEVFFKAYPQAYQTILSDNKMIEYQLGQQVIAQTEEFKENFGENASIAYNISDQQPVSDKELSDFAEDLSDMFGSMEEMYGEKFGDIDITEGYVLTVDLSVEGGDKQANESVDVTVLKVNGVWSMNIDDIGVLASVFYQYDTDYDADAESVEAVPAE